jgi:hypothetical protein
VAVLQKRTSSSRIEPKELQGYEVMRMLRKGQVREVNKGDSHSQAAFVAELFGVAA